jgi:small-conductance mechanosensitive channel
MLLALSVCMLVPASGDASPSPSPPPPSAAQSPTAKKSAAASPAVAPTPVPLSEQENVISFLGAAIGWYRQLNIETGLVEEPSESLYLAADQALAEDIVKLAFDYADSQAALVAKFGQIAQQTTASKTTGTAAAIEDRLAQARGQMDNLQAQVKELNARMRATPRRQQDQLARQLVAAQAEVELARSRVDFLTTITEFERGNSAASSSNSLQAQVDELRRSLQTEANVKPKPQQPAPGKEVVEPNGLIGLGEHLIDLRTKVNTIDQRQDGTTNFAKLVARTRMALEQSLIAVDNSAQQLSRLALGSDRATIEQRKKDFEQLITRRKLVGASLLALTKQHLLLNRYTDNLGQWRRLVMRHSSQVLQALLVHLGGLLALAGLIAGLALIWRRLAERYVEDANRRRQILKIRDVTVVILVIILLLFNFTTELSALATVVGFAAAGIAVALQDVILSIAGYFRLSGRFGIKHGDRVELQGVRGEVVELGLTKLTLLEMSGDAMQSGPTGRLVMIPNSSVFREKFLNHPGHSLIIWRELRFTLSPECDYRVVEKQLLEVVEEVFARYRDAARSQLQEIERNLNTRIDTGRPQSRVRLAAEGLQITLRFPVDVRSEAQVVDEISRRLLDYIEREPRLRFVPSGAPNIQSIPAPAAESTEGNHVEIDSQQGTPPSRTQSS